jgi:ATP-dependent RNA helicase DeaD
VSFQNVHPTLAKALSDRGYASLTPVQLAVVEPQARGRDLLVSARTGSGKTVAYGLVLAETLLDEGGVLPQPGAPSALVIAPTRELAMQVQRELQWLYAGARVASCVGGMDPRAERRALEAGCHIVVGTPGRLRDHLERGALQLDRLDVVILDEADEMLDLGFREELEEILDATPAERRTLLFSATLPRPIIAMAAHYQKDALRLVVGTTDEAHAEIDYRAIRIAPGEVELATVNVLRFFEPDAAIVFCATREAVRRLHANLVERGFSVVALSGELTQNERTHALQALRDRRAHVCVATDVAARGIDIPDLDLVIQADLPSNREVLQHRSGRTGRAGRKGVCVVLVPHPRRRRAEALFTTARIEATWQSAPSAEDIRAQDQLRVIAQVTLGEAAPDEDQELVRALLAQRTPEDIAAAYVRLARTRMPAPEDLAESEPEPRTFDRQPGPRGARPPEPLRAGFEDAVWFRIDIGRNKNAEARWVLPMICRRGHVTKRDIGAIRVFERETRFQVAAEAVERFEAASAKMDGDGGRIVRLEEGAAIPRDAGGPARSGGKPFVRRDKPDRPKPKPETAERPWTPPTDASPKGGDHPGKPKKAKGPKKRKPNG